MLSPRLFRFCSRAFIAVYSRFPVLGPLRSSIGVAERDGRMLFQRRSDGLGWAFPGGISFFWETPEATLRREFQEETGLRLLSARRLFEYLDSHFIPSRVTVFAVEAAAGEARGSWEGEVEWLPLDAVRPALFAAQQTIVEYLEREPSRR